MINLLPRQEKQNITYARRNNILYKWILTAIAVIGLIILITIAGIIYIQLNIDNIRKSTTTTQDAINNQKLEQSQKDLQKLSDNLNTVVKLLSNQVLFSKLLPKIASILPPNTALGSITLSDQTNSAVDMSINAKDRSDANQAYANISNPSNGLFDKADLISISCTDSTKSSSSDNQYPCTANIRATFSAEAKKSFINSLGVKK
jgi:hypothetical protein